MEAKNPTPLNLEQLREIRQLGEELGTGRISFVAYHIALYKFYGA